MKFNKALILFLFFFTATFSMFAQGFSIKGKVFDAETREPLYYAAVNLEGTHIYDLTDEDGQFHLKEVPAGTYTILISVLGYQQVRRELEVAGSKDKMKFLLKPSNLALDEVTVTAQSGQSKEGSTTYKIGDQAIQQVQPVSVSDILQLIPGNQIGRTNLNKVSQVKLRNAGREESSLNSFGTAIIVDGNQLSNDANMQVYNTASGSSGGSNVANKGVDLRDIPASNIESVEVITGVASAKYGNITSGAVLINRKAGYTPWRASFNTAPEMYQMGINKGFRLNNGGFLNGDLDYTYSNSKNTSRKDYFQRVNAGLRWTKEFSKALNWSNNFSFSYGYSFDGERNDPDENKVIARNKVKNHRLNIATNGGLKFLGRTNYNFSLNYGSQYTKSKTLETGPNPIIEALEEGTYLTSYTTSEYYLSTELYGKPVNINGRLDTEQLFKTGDFKHTTNIGFQYSFNKNFGKGKVLDDGNTAISGPGAGAGSRETDFYSVPASNIYSLYVQDDINYTTDKSNYLLKLGGRYDYMISKYHLFSPRLSISAKYFEKLRIRLAYGLSYKAPSMIQLYPGPAYFDFINKPHLKNDKALSQAVVTTYVDQPRNTELKPSKGETLEAGIDWEFEKWNIRLTGYRKSMKEGVIGYSELRAFEKVLWDIKQSYTNRPPDFVPTDESVYVTRKLSRYANAFESKTLGIELSAQLPKLNITNTNFHLSGSYMKTNSLRDVESVKSSSFEEGNSLLRYGVYEQPTYNDYVSRANLTVIQHIPEIKMLVTLTAEANIVDNKREVANYASLYAIGYYDKMGKYIEIPLSDRKNDEYNDLVKPEYSFYDATAPLYFNYHLQIRKETRQGHSFSFYANNFLWYNPSYTDKVNKNITFLNSTISFGFGINFKL